MENNEQITLRPGSFCHELYNFDRNTKVFIIIHGWLQSSHEFYVKDIRSLILRGFQKNAVFLTADWSEYAEKEYDIARSYNSAVGRSN